MKYYEAKVKYVKIDENGKDKKVTETYLVDAVSLTEMEANVIEGLATDVEVTAGSVSSIIQVLYTQTEGKLFKVKIVYKSEGEKAVTEYVLVEAGSVDETYTFMMNHLKDSISEVSIPSVSESGIMDVFNFEEN